jgi:uncharacterized protein
MTKQKSANQTKRKYTSFEASKLEYRGEGDNKKTYVVGYAAALNVLTVNQGGFQELIQANAFDDVLKNDVRVLFNRDENGILALTKSGTLNLSVDDKGLRYEFEIPNTTAGRDLLFSLERGDDSQTSLSFKVAEDNWERNRKSRWVRTITKVKRLYDVFIDV